jgi:hypothetical protein
MAIGKSYPDPSFRKFAGDKLMICRCRTFSKPECVIAASHRNKLSFIELSGNPMTQVTPISPLKLILLDSTVTTIASTPTNADAYPFTTIK